MRIAFLASSSKANCTVIEHESQAVLIDAGLGKRELLKRLRAVGLGAQQIIAIFVSHDHSDHAGKAGEVSAALHVPVYCSAETYEHAPSSMLEKSEDILTFQSGDAVSVGPFFVVPTLTYHNPGAVGFRVEAGGRQAAVFTDCAELAGGVSQELERAHLVAVETDYSEALLEACPHYDPELKRRIRMTHTSNEKLAAFFSNGFHGEALKRVVLLHLSLNTNCSVIAEQAVRTALCRPDVEVVAAPPDEPMGFLEV